MGDFEIPMLRHLFPSDLDWTGSRWSGLPGAADTGRRWNNSIACRQVIIKISR